MTISGSDYAEVLAHAEDVLTRARAAGLDGEEPERARFATGTAPTRRPRRRRPSVPIRAVPRGSWLALGFATFLILVLIGAALLANERDLQKIFGAGAIAGAIAAIAVLILITAREHRISTRALIAMIGALTSIAEKAIGQATSDDADDGTNRDGRDRRTGDTVDAAV